MPECSIAVVQLLARLPAAALLLLVRLYQRLVSPALSLVGGPACGCRFAPTCSHYAAEAIATHGAVAGTWLSARRLLKCTPFHPGGFDPVPAPRTRTCSRVPSSVPPSLLPAPLSALASREGGSPLA